ncbi:MAG: hypothetical protein CMJ83_12335 [Planctomycetes bacterium]|nr:hypothetical protein [Planctomycetota bacterium]
MRRLLILLTLANLATGQPMPEMAAAKQLLDKKLFREAALAFERCTRVYPNRWEPYAHAAISWGRIRRYRKAIDLLQTALQINPDSPQVLYDISSSYYNLGRWGEALVHLRQLDAVAGRDPNARRWRVPYLLGVCAAELDLVPEALEAYGRAYGMTSEIADKTDVLDQMAGLMLNSGRTEKAAVHFAELTRLAPSNAKHHYHLGVAYLKLSRLEGAEKELLEARRRDPEDYKVQLKLGKLYQRQQDSLKAMSFFQSAAATSAESFEPWYALRQIYNQRNNLDQADEAQAKYEQLYESFNATEERIREFARRVKINAYDKDAYLEHALLLIQHRNLDEAMKKLQQLLFVDPSHELAIINLAQILATRGQYQDAVYEMAKILERDPDHPIANLESARSLVRLGNPKAIAPAYVHLARCFRRMDKLKDADRYASALSSYVALAIRLGRPGDPIRELQAALVAYDNDANRLAAVLQLFSQVAYRSGQSKIAIPAFEAHLPTLGKEHPQYKKLLGILVELCRVAKDTTRQQQYAELLNSLK